MSSIKLKKGTKYGIKSDKWICAKLISYTDTHATLENIISVRHPRTHCNYTVSRPIVVPIDQLIIPIQ